MRMTQNKEILINLPISLRYSPPLYFDYDKNITNHHIEIHKDNDRLDGDDVRSIVIVSVGVVVMLLMWMVARYSKETESDW